MSWEMALRRRERREREERERRQRAAVTREQEARAQAARLAEEERRRPFRAMASLFGAEDPYEWENRRQEPVKKVLDNLKEALRTINPQHEMMAREVMRWTPARGDRPVALDDSDLDQHPAEHVERKRKEARAKLSSAEGMATSTIVKLAQEAAKEPAARFEQGTKLMPDARSEVSLFVEQYRGRTRSEQQELVRHGMKALDRNDLQAALAVRRAADVLGVNAPEVDERLVHVDPERQAAKSELAQIERLVTAWHGDVARRHVKAGMADDIEVVAMESFAHDHGFARGEQSGPYVDQALGQ